MAEGEDGKQAVAGFVEDFWTDAKIILAIIRACQNFFAKLTKLGNQVYVAGLCVCINTTLPLKTSTLDGLSIPLRRQLLLMPLWGHHGIFALRK